MVVAEKKMGKILPYMVKRATKIVFSKKSKEDKEFVKKRKEEYERGK